MKKYFVTLIFFVYLPFCTASITQEDIKNGLEKYLQNQLPGLECTYRDVIDELINHGYNVYIRGGVIRDLFDGKHSTPRDVDALSDAPMNEVMQIAKQKKWPCTLQANQVTVVIGTSLVQNLEINPATFLHTTPNQGIFTVNSIVYHVNSQTFGEKMEEKIDHLLHNRIITTNPQLEEWFYSTEGDIPHKKIFRFWKMVGKGYIYTQALEQFFQKETIKLQQQDPFQFSYLTQKYLRRHEASSGEVMSGAHAIMGAEWTKNTLLLSDVNR